MNEVELKKNGITTIKDAYKLGFFHGAIAMLEYIKARFSPENRQVKALPAPINNVGKIFKALHKAAFEDVKLRQDPTDLYFEIFYSEIKFHHGYRYIKEFGQSFSVFKVSQTPRRFKTEEAAVKCLRDWRLSYILCNIESYKRKLADERRKKRIEENNKRLYQL